MAAASWPCGSPGRGLAAASRRRSPRPPRPCPRRVRAVRDAVVPLDREWDVRAWVRPRPPGPVRASPTPWTPGQCPARGCGWCTTETPYLNRSNTHTHGTQPLRQRVPKPGQTPTDTAAPDRRALLFAAGRALLPGASPLCSSRPDELCTANSLSLATSSNPCRRPARHEAPAGRGVGGEQNDADPIAGIRRRPRARARRVCGRGAAGVPAAAACRRASARKAAKPHARVARATTAWCLGRRDRGPRRGGKAEVRGRARARQCRAAATPGHLSEQSSGPRRAPRPAAACCADPDRRARDRTNARAH